MISTNWKACTNK